MISTALAKTDDSSVALVVAGLTHDVRNVLHVIKQLGVLARHRTERGDAEGARAVLAKIDAAVEKGSDLCNDTLECGRRRAFSAVHPVRARLDLVEVAREGVALIEESSPCAIELHAPETAYLVSHRRSIERIFWNLVRNATHYGRRKPVAVHVHAGPRGTTMTVSDQGQGIPSDVLERIFDPYSHGAAGDVCFERFGLGLWIARTLVESLDGVLHVASEVGRGTAVTVCFPRESRSP
jgi:signal transduction histidine kinase